MEHVAPELYCVNCGYDLRGIVSARCPECGVEVDRTALAESRIPWLHRERIGWMRALVRTSVMVVFRPAEIGRSVQAPLPYRQARRFWLVHALFLASVVMAGAWWFRWRENVADEFHWMRFRLLGSAQADEVLYPLMYGALIPGVVEAMVFVLVLAVLGAPTYLFQYGPRPRIVQDRAAGVGLLTAGAASVGFVGIGTLICVLSFLSQLEDMLAYGVDRVEIALGVLAWGAIGAVVALWASSAMLYRRALSAGVLRTDAMSVALLVSWGLAALLLFGPVLWSVGLVGIMVESWD